MRKSIRNSAAAVIFALALPMSGTSALASSGYPHQGRAIDQLKPAADYSEVLKGRPLALGIMRMRGQGFVPSPQLQEYVRGVMLKLLAGVTMPPSFQPEIRVLAAPEFAGECTPDGTLILTVGLLEQLETEDELVFVIGHELGHAIYRHTTPDWAKKAQYFAVVHDTALDTVAQSGILRALAGGTGNNILRGLDVARHMAKLGGGVLMPQMEREQEDAADALGFDLMVKAGYAPEAPLAVMDKLAAQEAQTKAAADAAKAAKRKQDNTGGLISSPLGGLLGSLAGGSVGGFSFGGGHTSRSTSKTDLITDLAIFAFDTAVDQMAEDATSHHPATERADLLSHYLFTAYRDVTPHMPTPLPWAAQSASPLKANLTELMSHYTDAENAAAYIADPNTGTQDMAQRNVITAVAHPTNDHAYTQYVASEYYAREQQPALSEAALVQAKNGPEPSWEVYSKLIDLDMARQDYAGAQAIMDEAVTRFSDSPVLLPKRIEVLRAQGRNDEAKALIPKCKSYDIDPLSDACKRANEKGSTKT